MIKSYFFISFLYSLCNSYVIDYSLTKMITINDTNSYFGYAILLQRGNPPIAIVGAPKRKRGNNSFGSVYKCDLKSTFCQEYNNIGEMSLGQKVISVTNKNGAFMGSVLDGDDVAGSKFFTCAPRFITAYSQDSYYTNGVCYHVRNSTNMNEVARVIAPLGTEAQIHQGIMSYYDAAFGECGLSMQFIKDQGELLMGAPGKGHWNGVLVKSKLGFLSHENLGLRPDIFNNNNNYYGYTVSWGRFVRGSRDIWYVLGAPRAKNLKGNVILYAAAKIKGEFSGDWGSYFGASLLVIHKANGGDDILIGAPTYPGKTWDEGCVYYFKNKNDGTFHAPEKLMGKSSNGRFGTVIADLGDIDLDSFPDCAISAPYEDDGVGAVYLYYGTATGFGANNYHRISPSNFAAVYPNIAIRGFGYGISKGNDVDNNGHNEIVIGAYKSGHAFYFGTHSIINLIGNITSSVKTLNTTSTKFPVTYCLSYTFRNKKKSTESFVTQLLLYDERVLNAKNLTETTPIQSDKLICKTHTVQLKENLPKAEPLNIVYRYKKVTEKDFYETNLKIPVSSGCGDDNICQTDLRITTTTRKTNLIIGLTNELSINATINNLGEPAYQTKLYLTVPPEVSLINLRECYFENGSYVCLIAQILEKNTITKDFLLDITNLYPSTTSLSIDFKLDSSGQNVDMINNKAKIMIPVELQNDPFIDSQPNPESAGASKIKTIVEINHSFMVGNQGPSPLNLKVIILVPQFNGSKVLEIKDVEAVNNDITNECVYSNISHFDDLTRFNIAPPVNNNSLLVSCFEPHINCIEILCEAGFFHKSSETAVFSLNFLVFTETLAKFSGDKTNAIIVSNAYLNNGTKEYFATAYTAVYGLGGSHIPLWIYVISAVSGIALLLLLILGLYKCNFFKRGYKEKLECEQGIMEVSSNEEGTKMEEENTEAEVKGPTEG